MVTWTGTPKEKNVGRDKKWVCLADRLAAHNFLHEDVTNSWLNSLTYMRESQLTLHSVRNRCGGHVF